MFKKTYFCLLDFSKIEIDEGVKEIKIDIILPSNPKIP
jgi:hypothetical protein|tara:strand:- start:306 stop:419 length:114 start_codon:yes stop_codon:yes gene_type:complete